MSTEKEFEGKTLDEAIASALAFFGVEREKLEVEILNDAQGGIFGLMGAKKAKIRASKVDFSGLDLLHAKEETSPSKSAEERKANSRKPRQEARPKTGREPSEVTPDAEQESASSRRSASKPEGRSESRPEARGESRGDTRNDTRAESRGEGRNDARTETRTDTRGDARAESRHEPRAPRPKATPAPRRRPEDAPAASEPRDDLPDLDLATLDQAKVSAVVSDVVGQLVRPIAGDVPLNVSVAEGRVAVALDCVDASGLLVGRDGQTLAAVQYLAARMTAKALGGNFRLVIDAGNYRERQEDKLRELALELADKARKTGRSQSSRPLSAYQRRIIHLALENHPDVATCSKGDGLQRRVVVQPRRARSDRSAGLAPEHAAPVESGPDDGDV